MSFPGGITTINLEGTYINPIGGAGLDGWITIQPNVDLIDSNGNVIMKAFPYQLAVVAGAMSTVTIPTTDSANIAPSGWYYIVTEYFPGALPVSMWNANIASTYGASVNLANIPHATETITVTNYIQTQYPMDVSGNATSGYILTATGAGTATWQANSGGGGGGAVASVFGRTGAVVADTGDYSFSQISGTVASGQLPSATTGAAGAIQMTGDLAGTGGAPEVVSTHLSAALPINQGGTGQATASTGFNALSPLTTLGDTLYGGASGAGTRLAGSTSATKMYLTQTGTGSASAAPTWAVIAAADLPSATTSAKGAVEFNNSTGNIAGLGTAALGSSGVVADAGHVHPTTGVLPTTGGTVTGNLILSANTFSMQPATGTSTAASINVAGTDAFDRWRLMPSNMSFGPGTANRDTTFGRAGAGIGYVTNSLLVGSSTDLGDNGVGEIKLANATTNPTTAPTGGAALYASGGELFYISSSGITNSLQNNRVYGSTAAITGTTANSLIASGSPVPSGTLQAGMKYYFEAWGVLSTTVNSDSFTFNLYWDQVGSPLGGNSLLTWGATTISSVQTNSAWKVKFHILALTATSFAVNGEVYAGYYLNAFTEQVTGIVNTSNNMFDIGVQLSDTASTITTHGFDCHREF